MVAFIIAVLSALLVEFALPPHHLAPSTGISWLPPLAGGLAVLTFGLATYSSRWEGFWSAKGADGRDRSSRLAIIVGVCFLVYLSGLGELAFAPGASARSWPSLLGFDVASLGAWAIFVVFGRLETQRHVKLLGFSAVFMLLQILWWVTNAVRKQHSFSSGFAAIAALSLVWGLIELRKAQIAKREEHEAVAGVCPAANADGERWKLPVAIAAGALLYLFGIGVIWFKPFDNLPFAQSIGWTIGACFACLGGPMLPMAACAWSKRWWDHLKVIGPFSMSLISIEIVVLHLRKPISDKSDRWPLTYAAAAALFAVWGVLELRRLRRRKAKLSSPASQNGGSVQ